MLIKLGASRKIENNSYIWDIVDIIQLGQKIPTPSKKSVLFKGTAGLFEFNYTAHAATQGRPTTQPADSDLREEEFPALQAKGRGPRLKPTRPNALKMTGTKQAPTATAPLRIKADKGAEFSVKTHKQYKNPSPPVVRATKARPAHTTTAPEVDLSPLHRSRSKLLGLVKNERLQRQTQDEGKPLSTINKAALEKLSRVIESAFDRSVLKILLHTAVYQQRCHVSSCDLSSGPAIGDEDRWNGWYKRSIRVWLHLSSKWKHRSQCS